jgi:hypothetical protein
MGYLPHGAPTNSMPREFSKQPSENLDYDFDWTDWMPLGDNVQSTVMTADSGITLGAKEQGEYISDVWTLNPAGNIIKQFVSGGTADKDYKITCVMTTLQGRIDEREIRIRVRDL